MNKLSDYTSFNRVFPKKSWKSVLVNSSESLGDAIKILDASALQILMVTNKENMLMGTITDGDIRRGILQGYSFSDRVSEIMYKNPLVVSDKIAPSEALDLMRFNKLRQLPIIDELGRVIGLHVWDELIEPDTIDNTCVIMAGGLGKRLHPLTVDYPKPLIKVAGKPMLERILDQAKLSGFINFVMAVNFRADLIKDYFGDGSTFGVNIDYITEDKPLGTAGALGLMNKKPELPVLVINGDVLAEVQFVDILNFHNQNSATATMVVHNYEWQHPFGVVELDGIDFQSIKEKPVQRTNVNSGIYILEPEIIKLIKGQKYYDMPNVLKMIKKQGKRVVAFPMHEDWLDLGRHDDLSKANRKLKRYE